MSVRPDLKFFRELRVSDPLLKDDASTSTYTFVDRKRKKHQLKLHYKFDVPLYKDAGWTMVNQSRVHHAIASLNYGLFCDRIVYEYPLTKADAAYLRAMELVTAREQYLTRFAVKEPHGLILPKYHVPLDEFEPEAVDDVATIECETEREQPSTVTTDPERYAVLSSGGKESLLTYGILKELGEDVSPVYVNESGRHWHTALLSYRYHAAHEPRTRRIWTTVDRLYVGANRLLPCVRPDFQRAEADVYPTQLFTFNSYQIGVAGLGMHEGLGTLLMGNEFDEGPWPQEKGVTYWWGIYDQSQEFDLVLNEYYAKKGWGVQQTSLLRSLSSLVIEDLLASRYPELLATQTSCHATHMEHGEPAPCGRCSKCLGVMLYLVACGHDAAPLRYHKEDMDDIGARLAAQPVKIEQVETEHTMLLAQQRGWRFEGCANGYVPREHPEVQAIRFHPETSRRDAMPARLARRVYDILATRTNGCLEKRGGTWRPTKA
ncbi:MAG: hypothetical protein WDA16_11315 [Candidatus Thermoplasmatota archaeon]